MPDQFGNPTPQEILAGISAQSNAMVAGAQTPAARRNALAAAMGNALGVQFDPQYMKAKEIESAVRQSNVLDRQEGESALDYELRKGRDLYGRIRDVDTSSAVQVASRILALEEEKRQQGILKEREDRSQEMHDQQMIGMRNAAATHRAEGLRYAWDPNKQSVVDGKWAHVDDVSSVVDLSEWAKEGLIPVTPEQLFGLTGRAGADSVDRKILGSHHGRLLDVSTAYVDSMLLGREVINGFADAVEASINPTASVRPVIETAQSIANSVDEVRRFAHMDETGRLDPNFVETPRPGTSEFEEDTRKVTQALNQYGIKTAIPASLLTLYIYSVAKAQDARVTNMDFETIAKTVSAVAGNPEQTFSVMEAQLRLRQEGLARTARGLAEELLKNDPASEGYFQGKTILDTLNQGDQVFNEFRASGDRLKKLSAGRRTARTPSGREVGPMEVEEVGR